VKCGARLEADAQFCSSCGSPVAKVTREEYSFSSDNLIERVKELLHEGNVTRIIVKNEKGMFFLKCQQPSALSGLFLLLGLQLWAQ
jgi:hypothetical protein